MSIERHWRKTSLPREAEKGRGGPLRYGVAWVALAVLLTGCPPVPPDPPVYGIGEVVKIESHRFEIDATEVTRDQYRAFLAEGLPLAEDFDCAWNDERTPSCEWAEDESRYLPANCVDWCDARDFCLWAGKRLCKGDWDDPRSGEWITACGGEADTIYPYGDRYDPRRCNGLDQGLRGPRPAGENGRCEGGYPGLYDMSGNLFEWVDACDERTGRNSVCRLRGGSWANEEIYLTCDYDFGKDDPKWLSNELIGFRCCRYIQEGEEGP